MNSAFDYFIMYKSRPHDINEHMETLFRYGIECEHITELGVRGVVTTWAFLLARPKKLVSVDVAPCPVEDVARLAPKHGVDFEFRIADTGSPDFYIEPTDLLFIDTWHIYDQLKRELQLHGDYAKKYIIMHDTTMFGENATPENYECSVKPGPERKGLWYAIEEFLAANPHWRLKERYHNNNGLTVLERVHQRPTF